MLFKLTRLPQLSEYRLIPETYVVLLLCWADKSNIFIYFKAQKKERKNPRRHDATKIKLVSG